MENPQRRPPWGARISHALPAHSVSPKGLLAWTAASEAPCFPSWQTGVARNQHQERGSRVELKTILNRIEKHSSFVYGEAVFVEAKKGRLLALEIAVRPRANSRAICSGCKRPGRGYDALPPRRFEFPPLWGILVFFVYAMRRVDCPRCGVKVEVVPWSTGKGQTTITYAWFLAKWAKRLSWTEV